jgi:hypothetical protein
MFGEGRCDVVKLITAAGGVVAAGGAGAVLALGWGLGAGHAAPGDTNTTLNVVGEPYAKAVAILRAQGVRTVFGGAVGSDIPQAQCVVASQKVLGTTGKMQLNLDCSAEAQPQRPAATSAPSTPGAPSTSGAPSTETAARPTPGAPGVVTVIPKPVG